MYMHMGHYVDSLIKEAKQLQHLNIALQLRCMFFYFYKSILCNVYLKI